MSDTSPTTTQFIDPTTGRTFDLRRPGMGGLERIGTRQAIAFGRAGFNASDFVDHLIGGLIQMRTLLSEYLIGVVHPQVTSDGKPDVGGWVRGQAMDGRSGDWVFENQNPAEFARLGKVVLDFHATFRDTDAHFGAIGGKEAS